MDECIHEDILKDFLTAHREEIIGMSIWEYDEELARQAAIEDGIYWGTERATLSTRQADILELLEDLGDIPQELQDKVHAQTDEATLKKWLKLAAKAESFKEFEALL